MFYEVHQKGHIFTDDLDEEIEKALVHMQQWGTVVEVLDDNVMVCYCVFLQWSSCCSLKLATLDYVLHGSID